MWGGQQILQISVGMSDIVHSRVKNLIDWVDLQCTVDGNWQEMELATELYWENKRSVLRRQSRESVQGTLPYLWELNTPQSILTLLDIIQQI